MDNSVPSVAPGADPSAKRLLLASPRGFCAGVERAVKTVEMALQICGPPVYVRKQIVHNAHVVTWLTSLGAVFIEDVAELPPDSSVVFSAHGVPPEVRRVALERGLKVIDATCPLVAKVHLEAQHYHRLGLSILLIGHAEHDEVVGVLGELPGLIQLVSSTEEASRVKVADPGRVGVLMQTTLSVDDSSEILQVLRSRFPTLRLPPVDDICYATQNRQRAVHALAALADLVIVLGSPNSSNATRLREVAESHGKPAYMVDHPHALDTSILEGKQTIGVTASASTPEWLVQETVAYFATHGFLAVEEVSIADEAVSFSLPRQITQSLISTSAIRSAAT